MGFELWVLLERNLRVFQECEQLLGRWCDLKDPAQSCLPVNYFKVKIQSTSLNGARRTEHINLVPVVSYDEFEYKSRHGGDREDPNPDGIEEVKRATELMVWYLRKNLRPSSEAFFLMLLHDLTTRASCSSEKALTRKLSLLTRPFDAYTSCNLRFRSCNWSFIKLWTKVITS